VNIEADSLNAAILGPDAAADSASFDFFVREVVKEMTVKAGQKCTAIRRILVPAGECVSVSEAVRGHLEQIVVGDPNNTSVRMGPLVNMTQRTTVEQGIRAVLACAEIAYQADPRKVIGVDPDKGAFTGPVLLRAKPSGAGLVNDLEIFGPVATVLPYDDKLDAFSIAERGGGSLAASVFSEDSSFLTEAALALAPSHGRVLLIDPSIGGAHTGHGIVMPQCIHGGPGRAGGGEELGGSRGLWFYHQCVAMQGSLSTLESIYASGGVQHG
jgi:3,4-dehydroadipyl-CoA semialdehyde dehydrogenase